MPNKEKNIRLGDRLVEEGLITEDELKKSLQQQKNTGLKLGEQIIEDNLLTESQIFNFLEMQLGIRHVNLASYVIKKSALEHIDQSFAQKNEVLPIDIQNGKLIVAMSDPMNLRLVDDISIMTGMRVDAVIASKNAIDDAIMNVYRAKKETTKESENNDYSGMSTLDSDMSIANAPIVKLVNKIIKDGLKARASDIHIEPSSTEVRVRFRVDGDLREYMTSELRNHSAIITRIKIMGEMDISEKRKPQDGRVETIIDSHMVDMRLSALPTVHGEKMVIRLLDRSAVVIDKKRLGLTEKNIQIIDDIMKHPQGMILATGPTGSGKTTTLYSLLKELNSIEKNIITVEDPVEYRLNGINQVQVNKKAGLTFATGLRSILRQDPDIIMVGEIRDKETAQIAIRASITGHVVLSTLHTNDTASTVTRLIDMDVEPYILSSSLVGIISQRLVKKLCNSCKSSYITSEADMKVLNIDEPKTIFEARGCNACGRTGYNGRTAIHEIMVIDKKIRKLINANVSADVIKDEAIKNGMTTLNHSCSELILKGDTSIEELIRVSYSID
jgi:type IV pilus assembly protein PilB